ncbi:50S ribosomal protein L10 [Patescibacteria group bacterium]
MPNPKKQTTVKDLTEKLKKAKAFYLVDYQGLDVAQMTVLRQKVRESGGKLEVVKNRLLKIACTDCAISSKELLEALVQPRAILLANEDEISPLKAVVEFAKESALPKIIGGFFDSEFLDKNQTEQLASIPGREVLLGQLAGQLAAPYSHLVYVLKGNQQKLIFALKAIADNKNN